MVVDPFEDEVLDVVDEADTNDGFIDQRGNWGRKRGGSTTRKVWTFPEKCELMHGLKDLVVKGNKCDNGFRSGYLLILENWLTAKFLGTDLKGIYGVGLNSTTYHVDALPEVWDAQIRVDPFTKSLKKKAFPFYALWGKIFGNDRATGQDSQLYADAVDEVMTSSVKQTRTTMDVDEDGESTHVAEEYTPEKTSFSIDGNSSATRDTSKGKKRKQYEGAELQFMSTVGNFCDTSKNTFGHIASTMDNIAKHVGSEFDNHYKMEQVYDRLNELEFISVEARVAIA
ncbi:hypothetical protein ACS0TY_010762 [Phlomoides rotata]